MTTVEENKDIRIDKHELGPYGTNAYILVCPKTGESVLIDAPAKADVIQEALKGTQPQRILITHGHMDHVGALREIRSALNVPVAAHSGDASTFPVPVDTLLNHGDLIRQKVYESILHQAVRLSATDLHDLPRACYCLVDSLEVLFD